MFYSYNKFLFALFIFIQTVSISIYAHEWAIINKAVIDLNNSFPAPFNPPASPESKGCPRAHQGLYNEQVECHECNGESVKISFDHVIYGYDKENGTIHNTFWAFKKDITPLEELDTYITEHIPSSTYAQSPTIVLTYPWKEFSLGTRFAHLCAYDTVDSFAIGKIDYNHKKVVLDFVPRENALQEIKQDPIATRKLFVELVNNLVTRAAQTGLVIPYIWGGSSFVHPYEDAFYQKDGVWQRDGKNNPYSGYDCSELVMRMAQIAGLDFPWKTSTAIQRGLSQLSAYDEMEDGDLIWVPGHVMIISDIHADELIEARGYSSGYGRVHRITLEECFEGIHTYQDLLAHFHNKIPVTFKNKDGGPVGKSHLVKLLKLV